MFHGGDRLAEENIKSKCRKNTRGERESRKQTFFVCPIVFCYNFTSSSGIGSHSSFCIS